VNLPAIAEETLQEFQATSTVESDWREPEESLCPERRPIEKFKKIAKRKHESGTGDREQRDKGFQLHRRGKFRQLT
jgi:hypothetical protein